MGTGSLAHVDAMSSGGDLRIDGSDLMSFILVETTAGCSQYILHCRSTEWQKWDAVFTSPDEPLQIRYGWQKQNGPRINSPWYDMDSQLGKRRYDPQGIDVYFDGMDSGFKLFDGFEDSKVYKEKKISDIVGEIANRNGLSADIEDTKGKFNLYQTNMTDGHFITNVLLPLAVNSKGRADYVFYIKEGKKVVFKTLEMGAPKKRFILNASPQADNENNIEGLEIILRRGLMSPLMSLSTELRGYDPLKKEYRSFTADDNTVDYPKLSTAKPKPPTHPTRIMTGAFPAPPKYNKDEVESIATALWGTHLREFYRGVLEISPDPTIRVGDIIYIDVKDQDGRPHYTRGKYMIYKHVVSIMEGHYRDYIFFQRRTAERSA